MRLVTAIIRSICLERVVEGLKKIGVKGMTISEVKGVGEEIVLYKPYSLHNKIEIMVSEEEAANVIGTILDLTHTGERGDGIITVQEVKELIKIRTKKTVSPKDL